MALTEKERKILKGMEILEHRIWLMYSALGLVAIMGVFPILSELIWKVAGGVYVGIMMVGYGISGIICLGSKMNLYRIIKKLQKSSIEKISDSTNSSLEP